MNIGINGFGRIGRTSFRVWYEKHRDTSSLVAVNTSGSMDIAAWAHLLKYDSNYGVWSQEIKVEEHQKAKAATDADPLIGTFIIGDKHIQVLAQRDPAKLPWGSLNVDTVIESTGIFITQEKASEHLAGGAKRVIISAPPKGEGIGTYVIGVNEEQAQGVDKSKTIISNASCTTNCVAPVIAVLHSTFGIKKALMTTIHAYTDDQNLQDNSHRDLRRARSAAKNIVPTSTGAAIAVTETVPELKGLFDGLSMRVPVSTGSLSDMTMVLARPVTVEEINKALIDASQTPRWKGILATTTDPIVSSDIVGRSESSIVDLALTQVMGGDLVKVVSWYDNEWGYCNRLVEQAIV
ncbi:type I glyceraldehyde-3-phosphate dehydrogenase [Candidatus Cerribacteria bacterium 'Amazon FNV 2010 28 9']|uniref:Type I glyceraldehyde-3-phosphate dehydrogenase n=1 Tax=Candidatus Cerribacteria bacterium 'Amazon FNV 2010 28 9' TaxID=2081795 RepID=A0A317JR24_9BACT|nr:MAG: type I glyceraldehyde-3-phosphate dehydrogenase [Candidatus Cerribacteria bacterium 'Amazon FNV 2010 28 9']